MSSGLISDITIPDTPLDSEYRNRHLEFYGNGICVDSRLVNWKNVNLHSLDKIAMKIGKMVYEIERKNCPSSFVEFIHFRSAGVENSKPLHTWTIGWTNGVSEFLIEADFHTGRFLRSFKQPVLSDQPTHRHPQTKIGGLNGNGLHIITD